MNLPEGFVDMMRTLLGEEAEAFFSAMQQPPVTSVRINSRKPGAVFPDAYPVKWCDTGYYLPERPIFTLDPLLHAGAYYVQDASSMIHREVVKRLLAKLADEAGEDSKHFPVTLLDMCAAPGGKTTAMIDVLPDGSRVVANEYVAKRAAILKENLTKWGYPLATVTNKDSSWFADNGDLFDIVAVDAPCSGEGMMRKDEDAVSQWTPELIEECAALQREILHNAAKAVKPGGFLIYSTCTFNTIENEQNAEFIYNNLGLIDISLDFPEEWGIPRGINTEREAYRFMPHKTQGEGLFLSVFRKPGKFEPSGIPAGLQGQSIKTSSKIRPPKNASTKSMSISTRNMSKSGSRDKNDYLSQIPDMEKILSVDFDKSLFPMAEVTEQQALAYLRREAVVLSSDVPKGIVILTYRGLPLGPAKNIGSRANNLYPKSWRILMR